MGDRMTEQRGRRAEVVTGKLESVLTVIGRTFGFPFERNLHVCLLKPRWNPLEEMRVQHKNGECITTPSPIIPFTIRAALRHSQRLHCLDDALR